MLDLMLYPFLACLVLVAMHSYLGLHVIAREVIFVDLSLAQMAALGTTTGLLLGFAPDSKLAYAMALLFTTVGAGLFAMTRSERKGRVPQEAIIGIVYVVASAATLLVADKAPRGAEAVKDLLVGSILWVTPGTIIRLAVAYASLGLFHYALRHKFLTASFHPERALQEGVRIRWWDFWFYLSFGIVITLSVPVAGVLLVFSFLVVPAVIAFLFTENWRGLTIISWLSGCLASAAGLVLSYVYDLPTGPLIVVTFGALLGLAAALRALGVGRRAA
ncbi:MAG: metal ABC transporter permease [Gemmatimonadales bacterium]